MMDWREEVDAALVAYEGDPEAGHGLEDNLLWEFVLASRDSAARRELLRLKAGERTRWYA